MNCDHSYSRVVDWTERWGSGLARLLMHNDWGGLLALRRLRCALLFLAWHCGTKQLKLF